MNHFKGSESKASGTFTFTMYAVHSLWCAGTISIQFQIISITSWSKSFSIKHHLQIPDPQITQPSIFLYLGHLLILDSSQKWIIQYMTYYVWFLSLHFGISSLSTLYRYPSFLPMIGFHSVFWIQQILSSCPSTDGLSCCFHIWTFINSCSEYLFRFMILLFLSMHLGMERLSHRIILCSLLS